MGLLVVDMQRLFLDPGSRSFIPSATEIIEPILDLIGQFEKPFFTRHALVNAEKEGGRMAEWYQSVCLEGSEGSRLDSRFSPSPQRVFRKTRYNAFTNMGLEAALRSEGIEDLVLCGVQTHLCVESTARAAFDLGFRVFVAEDATASRNQDLHNGSLKAMADGFACIIPRRILI